MNLTCLSKGSGYHFPPSHILDISGFKILLDCPIDLSALVIFAPLPTDYYNPNLIGEESSTVVLDEKHKSKKRRIEKPLELHDLVHALPWYKTVANLNLWDLSFIDVVLISSPMGMIGLPFLTRNKNFRAKVYATEKTLGLGQFMMADLISMHAEFRQFYGPQDSDFPQWMKWEELESLHLVLRNIAMGEDGAELGGWQPLYSAEDLEDCVKKVQTLKYAEEACYNGILIIKAFSSGLEIGTSNWTINCPRISVTSLSRSIFKSAHAMEFDYHSLQGNDVILFSDVSSLNPTVAVSNADIGSSTLRSSQTSATNDFLVYGEERSDEEMVDALLNNDESSEEIDKLAFVCSCAIDSVKQGGSVLIPSGRLGIILQLLEQLSMCLESSNCEVPIFMISTVAEEMLAFTNIVPEWLCKQRQENLTAGKALFGHVDLIKRKKLLLFPAVHSADCLRAWQEPCIVFAPHWSLRLGPSAHFLRRWSGDYNSLLILEEHENHRLALKTEWNRRLDDENRQNRAIDELRNTVRELQRLQPLEAARPSQAPDPLRISARARLRPSPNLEIPPVHTGAEGVHRSIPPTSSIHLGIHPTKDSSDSTLRSSRHPRRRPARERLSERSADYMPHA
ncbi:hypothetical protein GIB67_042943 [Kingdonia uniflora]|uniref:Beta-Casp domain-containing protein n=1 Tax=Kingdonia uniflora TaxID=39325 RepID=A0A7J7L654_9MAGN|nr:hypothetical protein GIB67_042943 [Kingdonia uniflora]